MVGRVRGLWKLESSVLSIIVMRVFVLLDRGTPKKIDAASQGAI